MTDCRFDHAHYHSGRNYVKCTCGWEENFDPSDRSVSPYEKWKHHAKEAELLIKHEYVGTVIENGVTKSACSCGWKRKTRRAKPEHVWEGHRGQVKGAYWQLQHNNRSNGGGGAVLSGVSSSHGKRKHSWWNRATSEEVHRIAQEVFGGDYVSL